MGKSIQLVAVIPKEIFDKFLQTKRVDKLDSLPQLSPKVKQIIREFIRDNVGYDNEPIASLSRYNNSNGGLPDVGYHMNEIFPVRPGSSFWQLQMPEDMVVSIEFSDLLTYSSMLGNADEFELEFLVEDFKEKLHLGYLEGSDVVSFLPFIDMSRCKLFAMVDQSWDISNVDVPGVEQVKLMDLNIF